ncbi:MAG: hypothetical protein K6G63_01010 [Eubacterium sp.]|nr:hypothetical protein [Eubacterium sp.]
MKKLSVIVICILGIIVTYSTSHSKSYEHEEDILQERNIKTIYRLGKGEVRIIEKAPSGAPVAYKWKNKKYIQVKDPFVKFIKKNKIKKFTGVTVPTTNKSGKFSYVGRKTTIYKYNKKGKTVGKCGIKGWLRKHIKGYKISKVMWSQKDQVVVQLEKPIVAGKIILVDIRKKKVIRQYPNRYTALQAVDGKYMYITSGIAENDTERITKVQLSTGMAVKSILTDKLRGTAANVEDGDEKYGLLRMQTLSCALFKKSLYVRFYGGLYKWDTKKGDFKKISTPGFSAGKMYFGDMIFDKSGNVFCLGNTIKSDAPTNLFWYY